MPTMSNRNAWLVAGALIACGAAAPSAFAATKYWIGSAGGNFTDNANWSTTSGSACGANNNTTAPGSSDAAYFGSGCTNNATFKHSRTYAFEQNLILGNGNEIM